MQHQHSHHGLRPGAGRVRQVHNAGNEKHQQHLFRELSFEPANEVSCAEGARKLPQHSLVVFHRMPGRGMHDGKRFQKD